MYTKVSCVFGRAREIVKAFLGNNETFPVHFPVNVLNSMLSDSNSVKSESIIFGNFFKIFL